MPRANTLSLGTLSDLDHDDQIIFPSYDDVAYHDQSAEELEPPPSPRTGDSYPVSPTSYTASATPSRPNSPMPLPAAEDDSAIRDEPSRHVDYLSHDWKEEDIWSSWRLIVSKKKAYSNSARLENASWRSWAKSKNRLRTVSPETLNWLKDCDVTWLYGPLQTCNNRLLLHAISPAEKPPLKAINKKPILKKRSMSELMLQRSLSSSSLLKQVAASIQAQQHASRLPGRPTLDRSASDYVTLPYASRNGSIGNTDTLTSLSSSGLESPSFGERRHIHFNDKVEQCIALDVKGEGDDEEEEGDNYDSDSDDGLVMMKLPTRSVTINCRPSITRASASNDSKTIAMLPSTTLRDKEDMPELPAAKSLDGLENMWTPARLSPSPSQETLRPSKSSTNFLLSEDDDVDMTWEPLPPSRHLNSNGCLAVDINDKIWITSQVHEEQETLHQKQSGLFLPLKEAVEDEVAVAGLFGRVVDTVNTAKDIAHVIWNVGWRT
ncbi:MAG: hypothetical protein M1829_002424 [Trizodia sp. TS-e1964]|nr:MAG: hypothetical protein M1829_002424 [Trizodia sp. TS-e1964]